MVSAAHSKLKILVLIQTVIASRIPHQATKVYVPPRSISNATFFEKMILLKTESVI